MYFSEREGDENPGISKVFQIRFSLEILTGGLQSLASPDPLGPRY